MSATLDAGPVARFLGRLPGRSRCQARPHPVEVRYAPAHVARRRPSARRSRGRRGHVLCFLPGAPEIRARAGGAALPVAGARVLPLHGSLDAEEQDAALASERRRKVILATNVAETSLTVEA